LATKTCQGGLFSINQHGDFVIASQLNFAILNCNSGQILHRLQNRTAGLTYIIGNGIDFLIQFITYITCLSSHGNPFQCDGMLLQLDRWDIQKLRKTTNK